MENKQIIIILHNLQHSVLNKAQNGNLKSHYVASLLDGIKTIQHTIDFIDSLDEMPFESEVIKKCLN